MFDSFRHRIALKRGSDLLRKERWQQAAPLLGRATHLAPGHWESHNNLAIALLKLGRWEEAAGVAQRAISLDPTASDSHAFFGIALLKMERWEEAVAAYQRAINVDPDRYDSHERLGMAQSRLEHWIEAIDAWQSALKLNPNSHVAYNMLGSALLEVGRDDEAAEAFQRASELVWAAALHPTTAARVSLAVELLKLEQWERAISELEEGSILAPELGGFHFLRVDPLVRLGRLQEAAAAHHQAMAVGGPMPPLPGQPGSTRFEQRHASFWTPGSLGADVFEVERWLQELSAAPAAPQLSLVSNTGGGTPSGRSARLLFVLDNDYGELTTLKYLVLGQPLAHRVTLLLPDRLYAHNADAIPGRTHRYGSMEDVLQTADQEKPDVVFLCSGYLFCAHNIFTPDVLERLIQLLRERGCRVVTSDPFLGMLSKQDPRTLINVDIPAVHPDLTVAQLTKAKRASQDRMWADFAHAEQALRNTFHLYPAYCDVQERDAVKTDTRNLAFFNEKTVRPESRAPLTAALRSGEAGKPHWLFILASADLDTQWLFEEAEARFVDIVAQKLLETLAAGRHPILIAPSKFAETVMARMPTAEGIDILSHCAFTPFMSLLLSAEYAFYWNVVSHSLLIRLFNRLPIVLFDRGHLVRVARGIYDRVVGWYYQGWEPPFRDHREVLTLETVAAWTEEYSGQADRLLERYRRAPSPDQMIADLMGRAPTPGL